MARIWYPCRETFKKRTIARVCEEGTAGHGNLRVGDPADNIYPASAILNFTNAARIGNQVPQNFYKIKQNKVIPQIKLTIRLPGEELSDAAIIYFHKAATPGHLKFEIEIDEYGDIVDNLEFTLEHDKPE